MLLEEATSRIKLCGGKGAVWMGSWRERSGRGEGNRKGVIMIMTIWGTNAREELD